MASDGDSSNSDDHNVANVIDNEGQFELEAMAEVAAPATTTTMDLPTSTSVTFEFIDHFSLKQPSSTIRSRGLTTRVYELGNNQLQLEQRSEIVKGDDDCYEDGTKKDKVKIVTTIKRVGVANAGLLFLRIWYTLVAILMSGFTFVFAANVVVMQAMEIPRNSGQAAGVALNVPVMIACLLSLPLLVYSMASLMIFSVIFVGDTWSGHVIFRLLLPAQVPRLYLEWYSFIMYMGIPLLALCIAAYSGADNTKQIAGLTWYICILISFLFFCALVFYNEVKLCLDLTLLRYPDCGGKKGLLKRAVLATLTQRYCGVEERYFMVRQGGEQLKASTLDHTQPLRTYQSLYSRLSFLSGNPFFFSVDPIRRYSIQELQETVQVVTKKSWGLDKACCGLTNRRSQFAVGGPDAIEPVQSMSGLICNILGIALGIMVAVAFLYAAGMLASTGMIVVLVLILVLVCVPCSRSAFQAYRAMTPPQTTEEDNDNEYPVFQTWASFTVTKPKEWYCWFRLVMAFGFFFLWPAISFFTSSLIKAGILFLFTGIFSAIRRNLDAGSILREHSSLGEVNLVDGEDISSQQQMLARARAAQVLGKITHSTFYFIFVICFGVMGGYFVYFGASSAGSGENYTTQTGREPIRLLDDFYYPPQNDSMLYPNCKLTNQYAFPGLENTYAMDYNLMAGIAYESTNVTEYLLDKWFLQSGVAVEETAFVEQWRQESGNSLEQVSFKLFSFPSSPGYGILSIRGTETPMDRLFNSQMYLGTVLTQLVRAFMPFSWLWDSIYPDLLASTTWVASDHLKASDYYRITTDFANDLLQNNYSYNGTSFKWLRTTGVSLGGGLALITGAQTDAYAFAYSGPNPTLGRKAWDPPISMQELKEKVVNIKPDNDFVSSIGDLVPNNQLVRCRDWPAEVNNCHSFWRIMCEYLYTCGSPVDRAGVLCVCAERWGYPKPMSKGNRTFEDACAEEEAALVDSLGDIFEYD